MQCSIYGSIFLQVVAIVNSLLSSFEALYCFHCFVCVLFGLIFTVSEGMNSYLEDNKRHYD